MGTILNQFYRLYDQIDYYTILGLIFLTVVTATGAIAFLLRRKDQSTARLGRLLGKTAQEPKARPRLLEEEPGGMVAKVSKPLHQLAAPPEEALQKKIRLRLLQAGLRSRHAYRTYLAFKALCTLLFPLIYLAWALFYTLTPETLFHCVALAAAGYYLPNLVLLQMAQKRQQRLIRAMPDALDLMVVCVEAGLGLDMTIKRVGDELRPLCKDLSDEFYLTNLEVKAGKPRDDCLKNLAKRTGISEIHKLVTLLIQTNRLGTSLATAMRVHADGMRTERRQTAEEKAAQAAVKLVFPLILFILPAMFVVLIGPGAIRIMRSLLPALGGS